MLARVRFSIPDRPGTLGRVTSAIGSVGADIAEIDVLESESGRALDDVFVRVRDVAHLERVAARLDGLPGVSVTGLQYPAPPVTGHADLELIDQVLSRPERGLQTLVDGAPHCFGADWAALVEYGTDLAVVSSVLTVSSASPGPEHVVLTSPLRLASVRMTAPGAAEPNSGTALVPIGSSPLGLVLVRSSGLDFHRSELWRVGQVGQIVGTVLAPV
ncbi:ACT domain-containing protein [Kineosporia sp. NBRC 101731]|uniref:ACT domain-containing protein n=1 Tax=Kineosporia sp. NBRC 101731 TaxID=3032199 RepID=UPI0024A0DFA5|nr:ACT domain-containing protein [Kineosporia sp. NBRC 101731]GLY26681.1 amino acid-binding protein [Kineosporia sp. NBRC 101731]